MSLVSKSFSEIVTFSRSSNATRVGPTGLVEYAPHNLALRSQEFDNASWTKTATTITANSAAAPDGTVTADQLAATSTLSYTQQSAGSLAATLYTISFYFKAGTSNWAAIELSDGVANANGRYFDLASVAVGGSTGIAVGSTVTVSSASATNVGNGWVRCSVTFSLSSATTYTLVAYVVDGNNSKAVTIGKTIFAWGAQLSVGPYALDYTPTTTAAVYGPRFDYDPVTLAARGLLVEEQRTNLQTQSQYASGWTSEGGSLTSNAVTAPDGTLTGAKFVADVTTAVHKGYPAIVGSLTTATTYTATVFMKAGGYNYGYIRDGYTGYYVIFDLSAGAVSSSSSATGAITSFGNGWYRCSASMATVGTNFRMDTGVCSTNAQTPTSTWAGDGTSGIYIWGAQLEAGSFATSYIPTLASTVTRSADVASVNTLSPWWNASAGTLFVEMDTAAPTVTNKYSAEFSDTTSNNRIVLYITNAYTNLYMANGGVLQAAISNTFSISANTPVKQAAGYELNNIGLVTNGGAVATDTSATIPTVTILNLGSNYDGTEQPNGHLRRIAYYPRRLTNAEIVALTA